MLLRGNQLGNLLLLHPLEDHQILKNWEELSEDDFVREFSFDFSDDLEDSDKKGPPSGRKSTLGHQTGGAIEKKAQIQAPPQYLESGSEKCPPQGGLNLEDLPLPNTHQTLQAPRHIPKDCGQGGGLFGSTLWSCGGTG